MPTRSPLREAFIILAMLCALIGAAGLGAVWAMLTTWGPISAAPTGQMPPPGLHNLPTATVPPWVTPPSRR